MNLTSFAIFFVILLCQQAHPSLACLECFVAEKMETFPKWVSDNNLDPSEPMNETLEFSESNSILELDAEIRNVTMQGYSSSIKASEISADLENGSFRVHLETIFNVTFSGNHTTKGTILSQTPFSVEGHWSFVVRYLGFDALVIEFEATSTGFLKLTSSYIQAVWISDVLNNNVYFENLSDNEAVSGYEEYVNQAMFDGITLNLRHNANTPIRYTLRRFWQEELAKSTMADIIDSTALPPIWTTTEGTETSSRHGNSNKMAWSGLVSLICLLSLIFLWH